MYSVLIVEDEILVSIGLRNMIDWESMDMQVVGDAPNGEIGLRMYRELKPDLILTDVKMPVMDGIQMIQEIRREDPQTKIIILSCVQEFDLLHKAMRLSVSDYILKLSMSTEEMCHVIEKVHRELDEEGKRKSSGPFVDPSFVAGKWLQDYLLHHACAADEFRAALEGIGISLREKGLVVCLLQFTHHGGQGDIPEGSDPEALEDRYASIVRNLLAQQLEREGGGILSELDKTHYLFLLSLGETPSIQQRQTQLSAALERLWGAVNNYLETRSVIAVSPAADGFDALPDLYRRARQALEESYYTSGLHAVRCGAPENRRSFELILRKLTAFTERQNLLDEAYRAILLDGIHSLRTLYAGPRQAVWELFGRLIHWPAAYSHKESEQILSLALSASYDVRTQGSLEEAISVLEAYLIAFQEQINRMGKVSREVAKAIRYIQEHYEEDVSLQQVADHVEMSANYLSSLFKKELNVGFVDYLNRVRIETACQLLLSTNLKTYEVAARVGLSDESYFSRIFKRIKGVRPREYKRSQMIDLS